MSQAPYQPPGWPTVVPRIFAPDVDGLVSFLEHVFAAEARRPPGAPAEVRIGDSLLMVSDGGGLREPTPGFLYVYVPDVEAAFGRASEQGATAVEPPADMPYGERRATVRDRWGNHWQIARPLPRA